MTFNFSETLDKYQEETQKRWDKTSISILVFGPNVNGTTLSSKLRNYILNKCKNIGVTIRCEHDEFISNHRNMVGANRNLCIPEINAARFVDAIIIIPDSPGSFIELGMLSICPQFHQKVKILFNRKHEGDGSFVNEGPKLAFEENSAKISYVNYRGKKAIWDEVEQFLGEKRASKYEKGIIRVSIGE